jgi:hypothetical protein
MKAVLKFDLPEESYDFNLAVNGWKWKVVVGDLTQWIKNNHKNGRELNGDQVQQKINELLEENNINLWDE